MAAPEVLTHRIGPWPVWGWASIGAAGIGAGLLLRRTALFGGGGGKADAGDGAAAEPTPNGYLVGPTLLSGGRAGASSDGAAAPGASSAPATNDDWARKAISWLSAAGVDPLLADTAIRKYLQGMELDAHERAAVTLALGSPAVGVPPEGVPPAIAPPAPSPIPNPVTPQPSPNPPTPQPAPPPPAPAPSPPQTVGPVSVRAEGGDRYSVAVNGTPGATQYRVRWEIPGQASGWVGATLGPMGYLGTFTWLWGRPEVHFAVRVQAGNSAGWDPGGVTTDLWSKP